MAAINAQILPFHPNKQYLWEAITEADTPAAQAVLGGRYTVTAEGAFGTGSVKLQYSRNGTDYADIDATNLSFSADGAYNIEIAAGYILPVRTGGSSMDVDVALTPIP